MFDIENSCKLSMGQSGGLVGVDLDFLQFDSDNVLFFCPDNINIAGIDVVHCFKNLFVLIVVYQVYILFEVCAEVVELL